MTMFGNIYLLISTLTLPALGLSAHVPAPDDTLWTEPFETSDSILVCSRDVADSGVLELNAVCEVNASPAAVFRAAMRRETYRHTSKYVVDYRIIRTAQPNVWYAYQRLSIPFLHDRDYTLRYEARQDSLHGVYSIVWTIANDNGPPPEESVVRIEVSRGSIEIRPLGSGTRAQLTYTMYADPGGSVPGWLANIGNRSTVPDLLRAIRDASVVEQDSTRAPG
jgi:hypothetical protein